MLKVLLVENDEKLLRLYKSQLEQKGFSVTCTAEGRDIGKLLNPTIDILLCDTDLGDYHGDLACRFYKNKFPFLYIIGMSEDSDNEWHWEKTAELFIWKKEGRDIGKVVADWYQQKKQAE